MAFFKRRDIGRVYVIRITLPDSTVVHKVGMCHSDRATDRMMEILRSWFTYFRFVPYSELKLDMECQNASRIEKYIHHILEPLAFEPNHKVQGHTEMFVGVDEQRLIWFIRNCENSKYCEYPTINSKKAEILCKLLSKN
jgi:hypothetical protein